ncbi:MAG: glutaredoxin family protein [Nitrososphaerota archaeon]|nr:glutaredoxin family protein [Nitrososphaerota archaeon]MDG7024895.1 glutaredoxin family protein [Nitrososphaerota archaeon]
MEIVVFGREGCHLCDAVEAEIRSLEEFRDALTAVDIEKDPTLHAKYWMRIPVVTIGGREVFEASMMDLEGRWRRRLPALLKG